MIHLQGRHKVLEHMAVVLAPWASVRVEEVLARLAGMGMIHCLVLETGAGRVFHESGKLVVRLCGL